MGKRGMIAVLLFLFLICIRLTADFAEILTNIHSPAVMALAPSIVSFNTGALSGIENPALTGMSQATSLYYQNSRWIPMEYFDIHMLSIGSHWSKFSFSVTAYNYKELEMITYRTVMGNLSMRVSENLLIGANINYFYEYYKSVSPLPENDEESFMNGDLGAHYTKKFIGEKFNSALMLGLSADNVRIGVNDDNSYKGGVAYRIEDEKNTIPLIDKMTFFLEDAQRYFVWFDHDLYSMNYLTLGCEISAFDGFFFRGGATRGEYHDEYIDEEDTLALSGWCMNYGVGFKTEYNNGLFKENPLNFSINVSAMPRHYLSAWWLYEDGFWGYGLSIELSTGFGIK
ncbi:MAG: hypothetical protein PHW02_09180 [bacterium]|nr:hypothetical protein [bacterium]